MRDTIVKQEDFCGAITLTYLVEDCLDLPWRYLRNEDISKVLLFCFPKTNQFTCDKTLITFAQMSIYP